MPLRENLIAARREPCPPANQRLPELIKRLRRLALRAALPTPMHPPVLPGVDADEVLDRLRIALSDVAQRVILRAPVLRVDDVLHADAEAEGAVVEPAGVADHHRDLVLHREQADRLVRARLSPEEVDEDSLAAG